MTILITGATGYIGQKLALTLAGQGHTIHALIRQSSDAQLLQHPNIRIFKGDILDKSSINSAMQGCQQVYHMAALASVWNKNPSAFTTVNVAGLKNVLACSIRLNISGLVFTSTAGVAGHSVNGQPVAEYTNLNPVLETVYERSKAEAERVLISYADKGLNAIMVNPSRVYGPGILTESNGVTRLIIKYLNGSWKIKPGTGLSIGNYVYIDDVVNGHILAMEKAKPGERYLIGGTNADFNEFFALIDNLTGVKRKLYNFPMWMMLLLSHAQLIRAETFGKQPVLTPAFVKKYNKNWIVNSQKATDELGYTFHTLEDGLIKTLSWLQQNNYIKPHSSIE